MSLLRSARAPTDELSRDLGADDGTGSDLFTLVKISPCQTFVSNDPTEEENIKRTPCNITSFSCYDVADDTSSTNGATTSGPSHLSVDFDYELWYTESANINDTVVELESSMLQHLAKVFNLLDCPYVSSSGSTATTRTAAGGGRGRHLQIFGDELADLFVGVDSTPVDVPDQDRTDCIVPVMSSDKVSAVCQPMKGSFSASVNADVSQDSMAEASIKSGLLRLLRLGMNEDLYVVNDVRKVSFIGDRTSFNPPPPVTSSSAPASNRSLGNTALAIIIVAALVVFLIAGFLIGRNRKRKRDEHARGVMLDESYALDEEDGKSPNDGFRGGTGVEGSLAATDELALQPQHLVVPVLTKSSEDGSGPDEANENSQVKAAPSEANCSTARNSAAAKELAAALEMATAAAASAEKAGEKVTGEKITSSSAETPSPKKKKKKKRKKKGKQATDSPDSLLSDSLRKLDSIAEESEPSVIDESSDSSTRSLT
jgi:hypothetical protein